MTDISIEDLDAMLKTPHVIAEQEGIKALLDHIMQHAVLARVATMAGDDVEYLTQAKKVSQLIMRLTHTEVQQAVAQLSATAAFLFVERSSG